MEHSQAVCFQLIDDVSQLYNHHCSLCLFFHGQENDCSHSPENKTLRRSRTPTSERTFYSAKSFHSRLSDGSTNTNETIKASATSAETNWKAAHQLRRISSPTKISLRDLKNEHARRLLAKQSDEQLQKVYESQIMQYLNGPFTSLENIHE